MLGAGCPRVTHPFAARTPFPKEGASLDLHVLSTPPAFVLSQDQTLRVGVLTSGANAAGVSTQKVAVLRRHSITGSSELLCSSVPKESLSAGLLPTVDESYMALTFGTLLSSQGADAHRQGPFGPIRGNPRHITRSVPHGQTRPAPPGSHLVGATPRSPDASCLGEDPPGAN